jgi:5'-phosphate synthase pdxT subunit
MKIGVLAVQGNFREHAAMLRRLGATSVEVRLPEQLEGLDGLVIPGGESTGDHAAHAAVRARGGDQGGFRGAVFGTCAG